jgi:hypothetical protein
VVEVSSRSFLTGRDELSIGMDVGGIIYGSVMVTSTSSRVFRMHSTVNCDIHLNETLLFHTFQEVMGRQGASCPHLETRTSS